LQSLSGYLRKILHWSDLLPRAGLIEFHTAGAESMKDGDSYIAGGLEWKIDQTK
jgi:hypothetical protein